MQTTRPDRRVQRTRLLLRQAMLSLILEQGYDAVNVQDITDRADVGRATFYLHYKDKEDLLLEVMAGIVEAFEQRIQQIPLEAWEMAEGAPVAQVFLYAGEHAALYRAIMNGQGGLMSPAACTPSSLKSTARWWRLNWRGGRYPTAYPLISCAIILLAPC